MKRFLIFGMLAYEATGGLNDLEKMCDTLEEAMLFIYEKSEEKYYDEIQLFDTFTGDVEIFDVENICSEKVLIEKFLDY